MVQVRPPHRHHLTSDVLAAWEAIGHGIVAATTQQRQRYWTHWVRYTNLFGINRYLGGCANNTEKNVVITAFAARVRTGYFGRGRQVSVGEVAKALAAVSKTIELAGETSPIYRAPNKYTYPVERLIEGFHREDPPPVPQLAVPVTVPQELQRAAKSVKQRTVADLSIIAFYFLLRVGEYTHPRRSSASATAGHETRTVQFTVGNVGFFKDGQLLPRTAPLRDLLAADQATLKITNQKNGRMGEVIHHHKTGKVDCPVQALARRVHHIIIHGADESTMICDYWNNGKRCSVTSNDIRSGLRSAILDLDLHKAGIDPDLIGVHSLRAGGAMALKLHGQSDTTIMKMGRWSSLTFLMYIHNQIAHLSDTLSTKMSTPVPFLNIASIEA